MSSNLLFRQSPECYCMTLIHFKSNLIISQCLLHPVWYFTDQRPSPASSPHNMLPSGAVDVRRCVLTSRWLPAALLLLLLLSSSLSRAHSTTMEHDFHIVHNVDNRSKTWFLYYQREEMCAMCFCVVIVTRRRCVTTDWIMERVLQMFVLCFCTSFF